MLGLYIIICLICLFAYLSIMMYIYETLTKNFLCNKKVLKNQLFSVDNFVLVFLICIVPVYNIIVTIIFFKKRKYYSKLVLNEMRKRGEIGEKQK